MTTEFSVDQKHRAVVREIRLRKSLYPRWVQQGKKSPQEAAHEIAIMEAIAADYLEQLTEQQQRERLL